MDSKAKIAIIASSDKGIELGHTLCRELPSAQLYSARKHKNATQIESAICFTKKNFENFDALIFVGALGICVRAIAPCVENKKKDPAVINIDVNGQFVQSVLSGHVGGANDLTKRIARILGATPVISTASDSQELWALDTLPSRFGWNIEHEESLTSLMALFVNQKPTAILLEARDQGTLFLETSIPSFAKVFSMREEINEDDFELVIAVTPFVRKFKKPTLFYRPSLFSLGMGCKKQVKPETVVPALEKQLEEKGISPLSISVLGSVEIKKDEPALQAIASKWDIPFQTFDAETLNAQAIPNPSDKVFQTVGTYGVAEASALTLSSNGRLVVEKQKVSPAEGDDFTWALAIDPLKERKGFIEIVGAGPGDPELVSVKGKRFLQNADLILYAGSLVPEELTHYAKPGCVVRSSASMNLEEQFEIMKEFYDRGLFVVRLHTGDPCIYGAIQEQMNYFDQYNMDYHITPGISSFQAAAAALQSQFTIPEKVQSIILTRGEGRTAMPDKEKLHMMARSQSTMCIFLSATLAEQVQKDLLVHYPEDTPVAVCYKLTWKDEKIWRGELRNLAQIIKDNQLTLTTMIVVGEAIGNRKGLSRLYAHEFKHIFRK
ncbi:MAG: precorrin-4 C(11)-methyltransferase [Marinifilaceae bacterium]